MGSVSLKIGEGTARFRRSPSLLSFPLSVVMLLSVLATNLLALYAFTRPPPPPLHHPSLDRNDHGSNLSVISDHLALILSEISTSQRTLSALERDLLGYDSLLDPSLDASTPEELRLFLSPLRLPLGPDSRSHLSHMTSSVSHLCSKTLYPFMSYSPFLLCPSNATSPLQLLSRHCDPLPRRRCLSPRSRRRSLLPFPSSLWSGPGDHFDKLMWIKPRGKNDFLVDEVLGLARGPARIGLDLTPGAGNFAARMAERDVTVVSLTVDGKMSEIVSARGLLSLQVTSAQRFPFYDGVFDLVHTMELDDDGSGMVGVEFLMFDIDRVLRVGGLLWLDNYWCVDEKRKAAVTALIERFKYRKLKWVVGEKADTAGGTGKPKVYLSAVLQKQARD